MLNKLYEEFSPESSKGRRAQTVMNEFSALIILLCVGLLDVPRVGPENYQNETIKLDRKMYTQEN